MFFLLGWAADLSPRARSLFALPILFALFVPRAGMAAEEAVIIGFHEPVGAGERSLILAAGGEIQREFWLIRAVAAKVPASAVGILKGDPRVAYVEPDGVLRPVEPSYPSFSRSGTAASSADEYQSSWGVSRVGSRAYHEKGITGAGIKIAIADTGIDYNHPELSDSYRGGYDFVNDDDDPMDDNYSELYQTHSHGTNVAGIIAALRDSGGVVGVSPDASLYALKVLDRYGSGETSHTIAAIEWAVSNGMDILNLSIQQDLDMESLRAACDAAYEAGLLIVAAAGNINWMGGGVRYPAAYDSVVAVAATGQDDLRAGFSATGPEVEISAPGDSIYSTARLAEGGYNTLSGTSQAAPHVTGVAALILSSGDLTDLDGDGDMDNRDLRLQLQYYTDDLGDSGRDELTGFGLVNVGKADLSGSRIRLVRARHWLAGWRVYAMESGRYTVSIRNDSLYGVISWVTENGAFRRDLSAVHVFSDPREQLPQQVAFGLDASAAGLKIIFIPFGRAGTFADITITSEE